MNYEAHFSQVEHVNSIIKKAKDAHKPDFYSCLYTFKDIEDVIQLSHRLSMPYFNSSLISYEGVYYLTMIYPEQRKKRIDCGESLILEYGQRSKVTIFQLMEYGQSIIDTNAIATLREHFPLLDVV